MEGRSDGYGISDRALVESLLRELDETEERWKADLARAEAVTYSVDTTDIHAVADCDGKLIELTLNPAVVSDYSHWELAERLNVVFAALREEAEHDHQRRYGGTLQ